MFENVHFIMIGKSVDDTSIAVVEEILGLSFAEDYKTFIREYGFAFGDGSEIFGINIDKIENSSVLIETKKEKEFDPNIPSDYYVVENIGMDGLLALQNKSGKIIIWQKENGNIKEFNDLESYLTS
ncbi:SMI1/KNR4 family protein [Trichococcus shcherbakoviae]|uniref:SMI1/KNR4 family protein n=1 Tax=Trichococcus shcherbakoviae TaxID=2094020 RepID=UPI002AA6F3FD|nr:SMI1/KNR4 family protein [Trichococcus shcherbakoviae]